MGTPAAIFSPITVGGHRLRNRLVGLPVYTGYAHPGGTVSTLMIEHYTRLAESGVAMVVVANAAVSENGIVSRHNLRADEDDAIPGLSRLAQAIRSGGALACLQLNHAGRFARTDKPLLPYALDPTNLSFNIASLKSFMNFFPLEKRFGLTSRLMKMAGTWTRAMTAEEKSETIAAFGSAALRACRAGFDMVEIHGAGGYLLCQFLSSFSNRIGPDIPMGPAERSVFPLQVVGEIKRCLPEQFPVGYRLITREWVPEGIDLSEAVPFARLLEKEGIAYISASAASYSSMLSPTVRKKMARPGYLTTDVAELTRHLQIPTIISGRIVNPGLAERLVADGSADLIGLGRPLRADPQWVVKAVVPKPGINTCINCNWCLKRVVLDQGFNCRRWPQHIQEKTDLEIQLLSRRYRGLFVAVNTRDLGILEAALPHILPDPEKLKTAISPTFLMLTSQVTDRHFDRRINRFFKDAEKIFDTLGFTDALLHNIVRKAELPYNREVNRQAHNGKHGLIIIPRDLQETWRSKVAFRERGKIVAFIGDNKCWRDILVPIDMSASTLLTLLFLQQTFGCKEGVVLHFVHVLSGTAQAVEQRWSKIKQIVNFDQKIPLRFIKPGENVAEDLLDLIRKEQFDAVIMGRRGVTRIKRWLLGSVSAALLRGITEETLFLID